MEDYKNLVEKLRGDTDCDSCGLFRECSHESCLLETKAADAIENLMTENAALHQIAEKQAVMNANPTKKVLEMEA